MFKLYFKKYFKKYFSKFVVFCLIISFVFGSCFSVSAAELNYGTCDIVVDKLTNGYSTYLDFEQDFINAQGSGQTHGLRVHYPKYSLKKVHAYLNLPKMYTSATNIRISCSIILEKPSSGDHSITFVCAGQSFTPIHSVDYTDSEFTIDLRQYYFDFYLNTESSYHYTGPNIRIDSTFGISVFFIENFSYSDSLGTSFNIDIGSSLTDIFASQYWETEQGYNFNSNYSGSYEKPSFFSNRFNLKIFGFMNPFFEGLKRLWDYLMSPLEYIAHWFEDTKFGKWFSSVTTGISNAISDAFSWFQDTKFGQWFSGVTTGISNAISNAFSWFQDTKFGSWFSSVVDGIIDFFRDPIGTITTGIDNLMSGINNLIYSAREKFQDIWIIRLLNLKDEVNEVAENGISSADTQLLSLDEDSSIGYNDSYSSFMVDRSEVCLE